MASKIDIINMALHRINAATIVSLTQNAKEAEVAAQFWEVSLDAALRSHDWSFARRREPLAPLRNGEKHAARYGLQYAYAEPADCLAIRKLIADVYADSATPSYPYQLANITGRRAIITSLPNAVLEYTMRVENTELFDAQFATALSYRLASEFAVALNSDTQAAQVALQAAEQFAGKAGTSNARESTYITNEISSFEKARYSRSHRQCLFPFRGHGGSHAPD